MTAPYFHFPADSLPVSAQRRIFADYGKRIFDLTALLLMAPVILPVVFLIAGDARGRLRETAPYDYLRTPFRPDEMRVAIEVALVKQRMASRLRQSEQWFARTLRCIGDGVIATDKAGRIRFVNPVAERLTGWPQAEALHAAIRPLRTPAEVTALLTRLVPMAFAETMAAVGAVASGQCSLRDAA